MDPFNKLIIENKKYIQYIFTINNHHKYLLKQNNFNEKNILIYKNFIRKEELIKPKKNYYKNILFIGRLSKEKNIDLLIETWEN